MTSKNGNRYRDFILTGSLAVGALLMSCVHDADYDDSSSIEKQKDVRGDNIRTGSFTEEPIYAHLAVEDEIKDRYIVVFKPGTLRGTTAKSDSEIAMKLKDTYGAKTHRTYRHSIEGVSVTVTDTAALKRLKNDPRVAYLVPDDIVTLTGTQENPPSWGLDRIDQASPSLDGKYNYEGNGKDVHVYVLDTGINTNHKDFAGRILEGYDFIENDTDPEDCHGHGTHIAGTVLGKDFGVAKEAYLHGVRVLSCQNNGTASGILAGIDWITANHIKPAVVNMSVGSPKNQALNDAVSASIAAGVFYSIAAGNNGMDACDVSPGSVPEAMVVANASKNDTKVFGSNYGPCVDIFAPGEDIVSADLSSEGSVSMTGTSQAAPHVAGAAALLLGARPEMTPAEVHAAIVDAGTPDVISDPGAGTPNLLLNTTNLTISGAGKLLFDEHAILCNSTLTLTLVDDDLAGDGSVTVMVHSDIGDIETITLIEESAAEGRFIGTVNLVPDSPTIGDKLIQIADGATVTATYEDEDDGNGAHVTVNNTASVDCSPPSISTASVIRFGTSVDLEIATDETATVFANVGASCSALTRTTGKTVLVPPTRKLTIADLEPSTTYYYTLIAEDIAGNITAYENNGDCFSFTTAEELYLADFESGLDGVTLDLANPGAKWHRTDACEADLANHSASNVLYWGLDSTCDSTGGGGTGYATTPPVTVDFDQNPTLAFNYFLNNTGGDDYSVELIIDGGAPITLSIEWFRTPSVDPLYSGLGVWTTKKYLLSDYGTGTADIQIKFTFSQSHDSSGFMIDDIRIDSAPERCTSDLQCDDGDESTIDTCDIATGKCSHEPVNPEVCDETTATDMGDMNSSFTAKGDACLKITQYPGTWVKNIVLQAQADGSGYPIPFSWSNCGNIGTGSIDGDWSQSTVGPISSSCATVIQMNGSSVDEVTLRRWATAM